MISPDTRCESTWWRDVSTTDCGDASSHLLHDQSIRLCRMMWYLAIPQFPYKLEVPTFGASLPNKSLQQTSYRTLLQPNTYKPNQQQPNCQHHQPCPNPPLTNTPENDFPIRIPLHNQNNPKRPPPRPLRRPPTSPNRRHLHRPPPSKRSRQNLPLHPRLLKRRPPYLLHQRPILSLNLAPRRKHPRPRPRPIRRTIHSLHRNIPKQPLRNHKHQPHHLQNNR